MDASVLCLSDAKDVYHLHMHCATIVWGYFLNKFGGVIGFWVMR